MSVVQNFIKEKLYTQIDFLKDKKINSNRQSLWHATKVENAFLALKDGILQPHTSHRYWSDGVRRKESDPLYEDSYWMYGWSMTRKREYAAGWNHILLEFDAEKIQNTFEIQPLAWNNLFAHNKTMVKKEFEEFVIAHYEPITINQLKQQQEAKTTYIDELYDQLYSSKISEEEKQNLQILLDQANKEDCSWLKKWQTPKGKPMSVDKCLVGIYMSEFIANLILNNDDTKSDSYKKMKSIIDHPLFKGFYTDMKNENSVKPKLNLK